MKNKPECYSQKTPPEVYSGVPSFMGLPVSHDLEDLDRHDFAVMGIPWEGICTTGEPTGVELAPKAIRKASVRYGGYLPELDFDLFDHVSGTDFGDAMVCNGDRDVTFRSATEKLNEILKADAIPIVFGGDHSLSYPLIQAFSRNYGGKIGMIHFDAHLDNLDRYGDEWYARCSPFHRLYELDGFNPANLVSIGIRGPRNHYSGLMEARKHGAHVINAFEAKRQGPEATIRRAIELAKAGTDALYITVCSDALDVAHNPAGPNDPCGLSTYELAVMLYECGLAGAKAFDYMEVYPTSDPNNTSSHVACWMTLYMMSGMAQCLLNEK